MRNDRTEIIAKYKEKLYTLMDCYTKNDEIYRDKIAVLYNFIQEEKKIERGCYVKTL